MCYNNWYCLWGNFMKRYLFKKEDFCMIKKIFNVSAAINTLYKRLYELEINGKANTKEFDTLLDYLSISIGVEKELYDESCLHYSKCLAWLDHLLKDCIPDGMINDMDAILSQETTYSIVRRMVNILSNKLVYQFNNKYVPNIILSIVPDNEILQNHFDNPEIANILTQIEKDIEYGMLNYYVTFLNDYILDSNYENLKNNIIFSKYSTSFIRPRIEQRLVKNKFIVDKAPYNVIQFLNSFENSENTLFCNLKDVSGFNLAREQIINLLNLKDEDYSDTKKATTAVLSQCMLRSNCILLDNDFIEDLKYVYEAFNSDSSGNNSISESIINKCLKKAKKDKMKCKIMN